MKILFALLFVPALCFGATGAQFLQSAVAPIFAPGNTLLPLSWWSWPLTVEMNIEMAQRWGYALDVRPGIAGEELDNPASDASKLVAVHKSNPARYPVAVQTRRVMFEWDKLPGLLSPAAWCRFPDGSLVLRDGQPLLKAYLSDADAAIIGQAEVARLQRLKNLGVTVSLILNGSEYMPGVAGNEAADWHKDAEVDAWITARTAEPDAVKIVSYASQKVKEEQAVRDSVLSVLPSAQVIYYVTGDSIRGIIPEVDRIEWVYPYRFMVNGGTLPSWEFYYGADGGWMPDSQHISMPIKATNTIAQGIEGAKPLSYNWVTAGWSLTNPSEVADDAHYMGFLKYLYTLGSVGNVAGYFSYPDAGFDGDVGPTPPDWVRQIMLLSHAHAAFTHLEDYLRNGDLLGGDGQHVFSFDLYGRPSWPHPSYEFTTNENSPATHVAVRKMRDKRDWLIVAWAASGVSRYVMVTVPDLGKPVKVLARPEGSLYQLRNNGLPKLLDPDGMAPSRTM